MPAFTLLRKTLMTLFTLDHNSKAAMILKVIGLACVLFCISWVSLSSSLAHPDSPQPNPITVKELQQASYLAKNQIPMRSAF